MTSWKIVPGAKVMYNLTVAQDYTFTVGECVVHNTAELGGDCGGGNNDTSGNSDTSNTSDASSNERTPSGSFTKMSDSWLKKLGIDAHQLKYDVLGKGAKISSFNIYQDGNGDLYLLPKGGSRSTAIWTDYNISDFSGY